MQRRSVLGFWGIIMSCTAGLLALAQASSAAEESIPTVSYYSPGIFTPVVDGPPATSPLMSGETHDIVVASAFGRRVYGFIGGREAWVRDYPGAWPRGLALWNGWLFIAHRMEIQVVAPYTGALQAVLHPPRDKTYDTEINRLSGIMGLSVTEEQGKVYVTVAYGGIGPGTVQVFLLKDSSPKTWSLAHYRRNSVPVQSARHATVKEGMLYVADTFNHRVYRTAMEEGGPLQELSDVFYPNTVEVLENGKVRICEEHANRIFDWDPATHARTMVYSAPVPLFADLANTRPEIEAGEKATIDPDSSFTPKKSQCAVESAGRETLYSPNSAMTYGNKLLIADTDNNRVILLRDGRIVTEITGFNNPTNAVLLAGKPFYALPWLYAAFGILLLAGACHAFSRRRARSAKKHAGDEAGVLLQEKDD